MWGRRKKEISELDVKMRLLDEKLASVEAATAKLTRALVAASAAEKMLKATIERAESTNARLKRSSQGR